eukprot:TRINITY_DN97903_c0_g1_i1.p1 TRINITY_DN97903_c0_g1~~TRINITY_DN97903_c0_g1_i1.p1  ORF type:complete len:138 (-),score=29.40 TRINITY_DN97903_c0_g1_i1:65-478(-)
MAVFHMLRSHSVAILAQATVSHACSLLEALEGFLSLLTQKTLVMAAPALSVQAGTYTGIYIYECDGGADLQIRSEEKVQVTIQDDGSFELRDMMLIESAQLKATGTVASKDKSQIWVEEEGQVMCHYSGQEIKLTKK